MRIDWDTPVSELMHGSNISYVDLDENELVHFKYIKREKVNGKWRYYYHDDEYEKAKESHEKANRNLEKAQRNYDMVVRKNKSSLDRINQEHNATYGSQAGNNENWSKYFDKAKPYVEENNAARGQVKRASDKAKQASSNYTKAKSVYDKSAGHKVAELLNKASDKIDKAKQRISSIFKRNK